MEKIYIKKPKKNEFGDFAKKPIYNERMGIKYICIAIPKLYWYLYYY